MTSSYQRAEATKIRETIDTVVQSILRGEVDQRWFEDAVIVVLHGLGELFEQSGHTPSYRLGMQQAVMKILIELGAELGVLTIDGEVVS